MAKADYYEKRLEDYADVFADIVNVIIFRGRRKIKETSLHTAMPRSAYDQGIIFAEQEAGRRRKPGVSICTEGYQASARVVWPAESIDRGPV